MRHSRLGIWGQERSTRYSGFLGGVGGGCTSMLHCAEGCRKNTPMPLKHCTLFHEYMEAGGVYDEEADKKRKKWGSRVTGDFSEIRF